MTVQEIAKKLVAFCRKADWYGAYDELYVEDSTSVEPYATPLFEKELTGLTQLRAKAKRFDNLMLKMYSIEVTEPQVAGSYISFRIAIDADRKGMGRKILSEICVYKVEDGKVVFEEFFYD